MFSRNPTNTPQIGTSPRKDKHSGPEFVSSKFKQNLEDLRSMFSKNACQQNKGPCFPEKNTPPARNAAAKPLAFKQTQQIPPKLGLPQEKTNILAP